MALWHACMKMRRGYCTKYALNVGIDHSTVVRKSCVVEVLVVLRRLFIANSRAKCDRRRDYDRRRQRSSSSSSRGNIVQPNERSALLCSALCPFVRSCPPPRSCSSWPMARGGRAGAGHEASAAAAALIPSPITHLVCVTRVSLSSSSSSPAPA